MQISQIISGVSTPDFKQSPLISFNALYDLDIGVINLVRKEYLDERVFDKEIFKQYKYTHDLIRYLYYRNEYNPLYLFAKPEIEKEMLDAFYKQFLERRMETIIDLSVTTELFNLIPLFNETKDIFCTILYYDEYQKKELERNELINKNRLIHYSGLNSKIISSYTQYFIKDINEFDYFPPINGSKTFYVSSFRPNIEDRKTMRFKSTKAYEDILKASPNNHICLFDLYDESIIFHSKEQLDDVKA